MGNADKSITDLSRGYYRRIYAGFTRGKRINGISLNAEAWFWRINAAVDDFGNMEANPNLLYAATAGLRAGSVSLSKAMLLVDEIAAANLIKYYEVDGEKYLHVVGFLIIQPGPRNGKKVRRFPASKWEADESGGIQISSGAISISINPISPPTPKGERKNRRDFSKPKPDHRAAKALQIARGSHV